MRASAGEWACFTKFQMNPGQRGQTARAEARERGQGGAGKDECRMTRGGVWRPRAVQKRTLDRQGCWMREREDERHVQWALHGGPVGVALLSLGKHIPNSSVKINL